MQRQPADEVARLCAEEEREYRANGATGSHCFELFRRAFDDGDEHAMSLLRQQYDGQIGMWVYRFANRPLTPSQVKNRIDETLTKFWFTHRNVLLEEKFAGIGRVLGFMRTVTRAVVSDWQKKRDKGAGDREPYEHIHSAPDPSANHLVDKTAFWALIKAVIKNRAEEIVVEEMFFFDRKPAAIAAAFPEHFRTVKDVYRTYENLIRRLRRRLNKEDLGGFLGPSNGASL